MDFGAGVWEWWALGGDFVVVVVAWWVGMLDPRASSEGEGAGKLRSGRVGFEMDAKWKCEGV